jgi:hypothetical protein
MKTLPAITIGNRTFEASAEHDQRSVVAVTVKCGEDSITRKLNHQGTYDHTPEQFEKDVNDFAARLAGELASSIRSCELAENFTKA